MFIQQQMSWLANILVLWKLSDESKSGNASDIKNDHLWRHLCATKTLNYNGSPSVGLHIFHTRASEMTFWSLLQNVISLAWVFQTRCPANLSCLGKLTADFIAIIKFGSQSIQHEARRQAQNKQSNNHSCSASLHTD